jgi:hypothetical protein
MPSQSRENCLGLLSHCLIFIAFCGRKVGLDGV